jgi:UDP-N-acetylmuramoylalanine--D-glutamate ligase
MTCVRFSELDGARIGVWGAGREISSFAAQAARRLPRARIAVAAFDEPPAPERVAALLGAEDVRIVGAAEAVAALAGCDVVVRSPGVSIHRPELAALRSSAPPDTTPTSLWFAERAGRGVLGVTGTKGKSTTAALACHLARAAGIDTELAGNIGRPALDLLDADPGALAVVELSSYHLADLAVGPEVAVVTNLYAEHADWHGSEQAYREDKLRILGLLGVREAVLPARQRDLATAATSATRRLFGAPPGWDLAPEGIMRNGVVRLGSDALPLPGEHNALNLCAALAGLEAAGVEICDLPAAVAHFRALEHRLQTVAESDGLTWVDDSISTTPESALAALASFPGRPLVLLGGGQDRGQDYAALGGELARRGALVIGMPSTGPRLLRDALAAGVPASNALAAEGLADAVALARREAPSGAVVLLSPAAPSYDRFRDFEERGKRFAALAGGEHPGS